MSTVDRYLLEDKRGREHEFISRWSDTLCTHILFLDERRIHVDDQFGYVYHDTDRAVNKALAIQIDKILGLPGPGVDREADSE